MRVITCIATLHNLWLVGLAALVCIGGGWVGLGLYQRARMRRGTQKSGWIFLAAVATGSSVWCTHFIAMLAYDADIPVTFEPILTMVSLLIVIVGSAVAFELASYSKKFLTLIGGIILGVAISAMHYIGMAAYHVDGIVEWNTTYIAASVIIALTFGAICLTLANENAVWPSLVMFVFAVVGLHFTGMTAVTVTPLTTGAPIADFGVIVAMAVAVACVTLVIIGTGFASYLIDTDVTEKNLDALRQMAMNDALTGLPNRTNFGNYLAQEIERAKKHSRNIAVVGIDLDRFKEINDIRGHEAGDSALKIIAARLTDMLHDGEFVARIGGDEFAAVKRFTDQRELMDFLQRLETLMFEKICLDDYEVVTGASIGVSIYPQDGDNSTKLVGNADLAMYRAKADVTGSVCFYKAEMDELARARRDLSHDLRNAIELDQLQLYYQVQTNVTDGAIMGYEVLLRWKHPEHGFVPPSEFIPLAEETGTILSIGEWVLREACRAAAAWEMPYKIAVNLSAVQLTHGDLPQLVHQILLDNKLSPSRLELEITETSIIQDKVRSLHTLRQIRALGVTIAIDDFGTGYSSLETLRSFPFDRIKLDRSFMTEVEHSMQARAIIRAVLALGKSLDISVLAEGVETEAQLQLLKVEGCNEAQGFHLGRPHPHAVTMKRKTVMAANSDQPGTVVLPPDQIAAAAI
ncbi:EAL domain-containing protein [Mesorhizobium sp. SB112]|uniref:putative bifunctional diguanylate cyclase/phosphodiesterase n=1 Tax=Mesorhizobium sp. SB112 TaxID=3151853 RepID=UPI003263BB31